MADRRIVLLGKTGAGKSSAANTIFGEDVFKINHDPNLGTSQCAGDTKTVRRRSITSVVTFDDSDEPGFKINNFHDLKTHFSEAETRSVNGRSITLIDTPGFFDTNMSEKELKTEIVRCITECAPGPHAFLILLNVEKFTEQENDVIGKVCEYFSEEAFKYAAVVFTHGEQLPEGITIEEFVSHNKCLSDVVKKCGGRCHVIDNKYWNNNQPDEYRSNQFQVAELLNTIDKIVLENKGGYYYFPDVSQCRAEGPVQPSKNYSASLGSDETRRIVLLGRNGSGKSSLANTIFREDVFEISHTANSGTSQCAKETRSVNGRSITLIDTPGFFDLDKSKEELRDEIVRCIIECAPGPHVFLILLKVEKFTYHEKQVIDKIQKTFSEEAFKYAAVVFTHGDQLPEGKKIEEFVQQNKDLSDLVKKCGGRCHVFDNKYWKNKQQDEYRSNQFQVAELLKTIDKIVMENNGGYYTNEMLQTVKKEIQKEEERIRLLSVTISEEEITKQAKVNVLKKFSIRLAGTATGVLLGALLGVPGMIILVIKALMTMQSTAAVAAEAAVGAAGGAAAAVTTGLGIAAGVAAGVAVTVGAVVGGCVVYCEADKADSIGKAVRNTGRL